MKKGNVVLAVMAIAGLGLTGCQDHPDTGVIDTESIRIKADVSEVKGTAYGLKETSIDAVKTYQEDRHGLFNIRSKVAEYAVGNNGSTEGFALDLKYAIPEEAATEQAIKDYALSANDAMKAEYAVIQEELAGYQKKLAEASSELEDLKGVDAQMAAAIKSEKAAVDHAQGALEDMMAKANDVHKRVGEKMSTLAEKLGYTGRRKLSYNDNLIGRYRMIDFSNRSDQPKNCPDIDGNVSIDTRDLNNQCAYLNLGTIWKRDPAVEKEARSILATHFRELAEVQAKIGERDDSGTSTLYGVVNTANAALKKARAEAIETHGSERDRERRAYQLRKVVDNAEYRIERLSDAGNQKSRLYEVDFEYADNFNDTLGGFEDAMFNDLFTNQIVALDEITHETVDGKTNGHFEEVGGDYTGVIAIADIVANMGNSKAAFRFMDFVDLKLKEVQDADEIVMKTSRDNLEVIRSFTDEEEKRKEVMKYLRSVARSTS